MLVLAQTGVRHFIGLAPLTVLRWLLQASPAPVVRWFMWRTWRVLLADLGPDRRFWTGAAEHHPQNGAVEGEPNCDDGCDRRLHRPLPSDDGPFG